MKREQVIEVFDKHCTLVNTNYIEYIILSKSKFIDAILKLFEQEDYIPVMNRPELQEGDEEIRQVGEALPSEIRGLGLGGEEPEKRHVGAAIQPAAGAHRCPARARQPIYPFDERTVLGGRYKRRAYAYVA